MKIVFDCICGNKHELVLNPQHTLYIIGAIESEYGLKLCRDDLCALSRIQCNIRYIDNSWEIYDGCPPEMPLPEGKTDRKSARGTYVIRENKRIQVTVDKGLQLKLGDKICFVPTQIQILYKGKPVILQTEFAYIGVVTEETDFVHDTDDFIEKLQKQQFTEIEPAPERVRQKFGELYELTKEITNQIKNTQQALNIILNFIFEKIPATRAAGIIMVHPDGKLEPIVGRVSFKTEFKFSRTVAEMVLDSKKPIVSRDISEKIQYYMKRRDEDKTKDDGTIPSLGQSVYIYSIKSVIVIPLFEDENIIGLLWLDNRKGDKTFNETDFYLSVAVANLVQLVLLHNKYRSMDLQRVNMERFFSPAALEWIQQKTSKGKQVKLSVREREVTILFVDIVDSTRLSKKLTPTAFYEYLTPHYYQTMSEAIFTFNGHVDDFNGDGIMAIFGDILGLYEPKEIPKSKYAVDAVSAAIKMVNDWCNVVKKIGLPEEMKIRIGIHSGRAVVGCVGYEKRMEFTALGKDVNIGSRIEKFAEPNGIVISDATYQLVKDKFKCEDIGLQEIRGITEDETSKMRLWKVVEAK